MNYEISQLADWFNQASRIVFLTGAGVSAESGLATFRGASLYEEEALWDDVDPYQMASMEGFVADPGRVWSWYQWRRRQVLKAQPNAAHEVIAWLEQYFSTSLITQNVDGLHQLAGSKNVCALHGQIMVNVCRDLSCGHSAKVIDVNEELVTCPQCHNSYLRPGVVWFGESLNSDVLAYAESVTYSCDLFLSVGTSSQVYPAAGFAQLAKSRGAKVVEVNIEQTELSSMVDLLINQPAVKVFEQLKHQLKQ